MPTERFSDFAIGPEKLARRLLGQRLVRVVDGVRCAGLIVEVEAYLGVKDRAAHSFGGRRTERNESMYMTGGHAYIYFIYGVHHCMNVVCGTVDEPVAVLIRAIEPTEGLQAMRGRRGGSGGWGEMKRDIDLCSGPGKLAQALGIDRSMDGVDLRLSDALIIERVRRRALPEACIDRTPRIGVGYAGAWASRPLRFSVKGSRFISRPPGRQ